MINHPVHIITKENKLSPSAFIPFCDFGGNMSAVGKMIDNFTDPVCNSFETKILNDQLCYEVDLNKFSINDNIKSELEIGFNFALDYNEGRQVNFDPQNIRQNRERSFAKNVLQYDQRNQNAHIYFDTIGISNIITLTIKIKKKITMINDFVEPVQLTGDGEYNLNNLKVITVTDSFLGLDENNRGCQDKKAFNCSTQKHIDTFLDKCGCLPLNMKLSDKVGVLN